MKVAHIKRQPRTARINDYGGVPYVTDLNTAALRNENFRTAIWTGGSLQTVLMSVPVGGEVGLEIHEHVDQLLYIVSGSVMVLMGDARDKLTFRQGAANGYGVFVPAGTWHNLINAGKMPVKLVTVYAPPEHPSGTVEVFPPGTVASAVPTYPAAPVRPPANSVQAVPTYPARPSPPPITTLPAAPFRPARPVNPGTFIPLSMDADAVKEEFTEPL